MTYVARTKKNPGEVYPAADQQQSIDNEAALYAAILGPGPVAAGGVVRKWVKKTAVADNVATELFTITTTNEAGNNDGGSYLCIIDGFATHGDGPTGDTSLLAYGGRFARALNGAGTPGVSSAVVLSITSPLIAASTVAQKTITTVVFTTAETSEYVISVLITADLAGAVITTASCFAFVTLYYVGFTTPPVITSAG